MCVYKKEKLLKGEEDLSVHSSVEKLNKNFMLVKLSASQKLLPNKRKQLLLKLV